MFMTPKPVIRTDAPPLTFISIIPDFPGKEAYTASLIRERFEKTSIPDYAMSYPLHPQGKDPLDKVRIQAASFAKLKKLLADCPIRLGILFQSFLGHGSTWSPHPDNGLEGQLILTHDGVTTARFCPFEKNFLSYVDQAVTLLVKEGPAFCLADDDLRMGRDTCYCPKHLEFISRKVGRTISADEVFEAVERATLESDPYREMPILRHASLPTEDDLIARAFVEAQVAGIHEICRTVRKAIDKVAKTIFCGGCMVNLPEYYDDVVTTLAGEAGSPLLRVSNGSYLEGAVKDLGNRLAATGFVVEFCRDKGWTLLDESDTCPHNCFSKTARTMHLHIAVGITMGLDGGKLWLDQTGYPLREISYPYEEILAKNMGFYRELHRLSRAWKPAGLVTRVPPLERGMLRDTEWGARCFNYMGFPFCYGSLKDAGITALAGSQVDRWTDEELTEMLSGPALIDGPAAWRLTERGLSSLLGVKAEKKEYSASGEKCVFTGIESNFSHTENTPFLTMLPGAKALSQVFFRAYAGDEMRKVMPGAVIFRNERGGKIITVAMDENEWHWMTVINPARKRMFLAWLSHLDGIPCVATAAQHCKLFAGTLSTGETAVACFNLSYDPLPLRFLVTKEVKALHVLQPEGDWKEVKFSWEDSIVEFLKPLETAESCIFRF